MADIYYTEQGDTWDKIAYEQYGDEKYMKQLILANWDKLDTLVFSEGEQITLPDIEDDSMENMPSWRSEDDEDAGIPDEEVE